MSLGFILTLFQSLHTLIFSTMRCQYERVISGKYFDTYSLYFHRRMTLNQISIDCQEVLKQIHFSRDISSAAIHHRPMAVNRSSIWQNKKKYSS